MKNFGILLAVMFLVLSGSTGYAGLEGSPEEKAVMKAGEAGSENPVRTGQDLKGENVKNRVCPVMGSAIDESSVIKVEYKGKVYNLCCTGCVKAFKNNPEKYSSIAEESAAIK